MVKLLAYPLTVVYYIFFGLTLVIFQPIQWFCLNVFGYRAHQKSVAALNRSIMACTAILGTRYSFKNPYNLPTDRPLIIVSNHQSMYDIPPIVWYMRRNHPKFVSKKELGKGIPSVSYNLRHGGSVLIDRKDSRQALKEISKLGRYIETYHRSAVIFPEGTRSRDGHPKKFQPMGLKMLMKNAPSALIVPLTINNSWKLLRYGKFPMGVGSKVSLEVHAPFEITDDLDALVAQAEKEVSSGIRVSS